MFLPIFCNRFSRSYRMSHRYFHGSFLLKTRIDNLRSHSKRFSRIFYFLVYTMADLAFHDLFARMGFNPATRTIVVEEGYDTMESLADLDDTGIDQMIRHMQRRAGLAADVIFRMPAIKKLKAVVFWVQEQLRLNLPPQPALITAATMADITRHRNATAARIAVNAEVVKPFIF
jgi:hypothetical protein